MKITKIIPHTSFLVETDVGTFRRSALGDWAHQEDGVNWEPLYNSSQEADLEEQFRLMQANKVQS